MQRTLLLMAAIISSTSLFNMGCRSCSSCHDYSPPVANCCNSCGTQRAGSASGGYVEGEVYDDRQMVEHAQ